MLTIQDVIERCEMNCNGFEMLSKHYEDYGFENNKDYQECYLVKQCLEELMLIKEILKHDVVYIIDEKCVNGYVYSDSGNFVEDCTSLSCSGCCYQNAYVIRQKSITLDVIRQIVDSNQGLELYVNCFFDYAYAKRRYELLNNIAPTHTCTKCNYTFPESESYKWRINNRIVDCCPKCKQPIMYAMENK